MKHEWKKHEKNLYGVKPDPKLVTVPAQNFIMISGKGNPNDKDFSDRVAALYSLAYAVKMNYKSPAMAGKRFAEISDFTVYPLEGEWKPKEDTELIKNKLEYTIMIRQPDFISKEMVMAALEKVKDKKPSPLLEEIRFDTIEDGLCVEILHIGSFDEEPASFDKMDRYTEQNGLKRSETFHREIYLNHAKRVLAARLQTILRYRVEEIPVSQVEKSPGDCYNGCRVKHRKAIWTENQEDIKCR